MLKVGLTGGIGSGKSTVSRMFANKNINIIDADLIAREVLDLYPQIKERIKNEFGEGFFDMEGNLKRRELGSFVFSNRGMKDLLEEIMEPFIEKEIFLRFEKHNDMGVGICILDAPTLIEQGIDKQMDINILVWVDRNTQLKRIKTRDNLSMEEIVDRVNSQISLDEKTKMVDFVIDNTGDLEKTEEQVEEIFQVLKMLKEKK